MDIEYTINETKNCFRKFIDDSELQRLSAKLLKCCYDALIKEGFTCDQSLKILCANPQLVKII